MYSKAILFLLFTCYAVLPVSPLATLLKGSSSFIAYFFDTKKTHQMAGVCPKANSKVFEKQKREAVISPDPSLLPSAYDFNWQYTQQYQTSGDTFYFNYFLAEGENYFGSQPNISDASLPNNMISVVDLNLNLMTVFMETEDKKQAQILLAYPYPRLMLANQTSYSLTEIASKEIKSIRCQGYRMENNQYSITSYINPSSKLRVGLMGIGNLNMPPDFDPRWMEEAGNGLLMELEIQSKAEDIPTIRMNCLSLTPKTKTLIPANYDFIK